MIDLRFNGEDAFLYLEDSEGTTYQFPISSWAMNSILTQFNHFKNVSDVLNAREGGK